MNQEGRKGDAFVSCFPLFLIPKNIRENPWLNKISFPIVPFVVKSIIENL